ncbi:MAG: hypothetical protein P9L94_03815 [Candidatus Hinthialibacter antarcticus]|nr:hypothetical protein [Candidatus Hinthialibacter antarcticus]
MKKLLVLTILFASVSAVNTFADDEIYLLSFFKDNGQAGVFLAYSEDGLKFTTLNDDKPIFAPPEWENQNLTRDPSIVFHDGVFHMVWTSNWDGTVFGAATSKDLITWSKPIRVKPFADWPKDDMPRNTWAPDLHRDPIRNDFFILWSSSTKSVEGTGGHDSGGLENGPDKKIKEDLRYHRTFASRTKDFKTFSPAQLFFDPGMSEIDASMAFDDRDTNNEADDRWVMAVKHEQIRELGGKNIRITTTGAQLPLISPAIFHSPHDPAAIWSQPVAGLDSTVQPRHMVEGPTLLKIGKEWRLYFDRFDMRENRFGLATSSDLAIWTDRTDDLSIHPEARHGTVFLASKSAVGFLN